MPNYNGVCKNNHCIKPVYTVEEITELLNQKANSSDINNIACNSITKEFDEEISLTVYMRGKLKFVKYKFEEGRDLEVILVSGYVEYKGVNEWAIDLTIPTAYDPEDKITKLLRYDSTQVEITTDGDLNIYSNPTTTAQRYESVSFLYFKGTGAVG